MKKYEIFRDDAFCWIENALEKNIKVNHIITDPPYNISKKNNFSTTHLGFQVLPFGQLFVARSKGHQGRRS